MSNKTQLLKIRVTVEDLNFIRAQAESAGLPASTYARALVLGHTMRSGSDAALLDELRELKGLLDKQGGLCKQLWKAGADPKATKSALDDMGHTAKVIEQAAAKLAPC